MVNAPSQCFGQLLWHGLSDGTRSSYGPAIKSWEGYCDLHGVVKYPAPFYHLGEWITQRILGNASLGMSRIKPATARVYVSAIRSHHVDANHDISVFNNPIIKRILDGATSMNPSTTAERLPITKDILAKLVTPNAKTVKDLNFNAAATMAFAGFLRLGEITYTKAQKDSHAFTATKCTRNDITLAEDHMTLRLKRSKTDVNHQGVSITIAASGQPDCAVQAMKHLFQNDPQPRNAPLFRFELSAFTSYAVRNELKNRVTAFGLHPKLYSGHSFRKGAAQHARDNGFTDGQIQQLGRWSSQAFQLYCSSSLKDLFRLSANFQRGTPIPFSSLLALDAMGEGVQAQRRTGVPILAR
jgi:hypothetical protein